MTDGQAYGLSEFSKPPSSRSSNIRKSHTPNDLIGCDSLVTNDKA